MRIAAVLAVAAAYGVFVDALSQDVPGHSMLRNLVTADENQSHLVPALYLMADNANTCTSWGTDLACVFGDRVNSLKLGDSSCLHVPIPTDNYVSDKRKNKFDGALTDPYTGEPSIEVTTTKQGTSDKKSTGRQTWKDYKANALAIQQGAIQFTTPGLYDTSITASDYGAEVSCPGCIAILDKFRPLFGVECPFPAGSSLSTSLTGASLSEFAQADALFDTVTAGYENNAESEAPPAGTTCGSSSAQWSVCSLDRTITVTAADVAKISVALSQTAKDNSETVITSLGSPTGADKETDIYRTIPCTEFASATNTDPACVYNQKLSKLLATTTDFADYFPTDHNGVDATDVVFWRYKRSGDDWAVWDPTADSALSFTLPETSVSIEAWTAVGQVGATFDFKVKLYLHTSLVCDNFAGLWTAVSGAEKPGRTFCNVPGSDFSVMKFKYATTDIFPVDALKSKVTGTATSVVCTMAVKETGAGATQPVTILDSTDAAIDKDFSIELVHDPNTAPSTTVDVTCTFTRTAHTNGEDDDAVMLADTEPYTKDCSDAFTLIDCDEPELLPGVAEADVCADKCAGNSAPGLGEACGGNIVTATDAATSLLERINPNDQTCCADCSAIRCQAAGGSSTAKACLPPLLAQLSAAEEKVFSSETATALLGASAMVAVVALIVVKRRADAAAREREAEDAYYPLLE
ncbi:hypothetical protein PHYSODRAFT_520656 [Phytophthora sojae]|uniref:Uncharacterized protein n=1 Tax=Phytophthora sojae (strain P6497) TaxID=1094619 RepID=G5A1R9_PHYSP|nr:hypothetical protein PHYSODRAFT_520656 [Phytophthora sojae]EGZ10867.1 hypothetical protein PHYSODRAFT_520656 [Phytophthora sojae]|eukprot:XP_009533612.1 hypothetical protein PHYSODRAFT_520656 [Phytophthora sojae]